MKLLFLFPENCWPLLRILRDFWLLGQKIIIKHISCGIYPSQWQKHLGNGSVCMYFQEINLLCLFLGNFPPILMCLWGFLSFGPKMAPNMYCAISTLPNNKTPERWPTSDHVMSLSGNFWPVLRFLLFSVFWCKNYPENTYREVSMLSDDKHTWGILYALSRIDLRGNMSMILRDLKQEEVVLKI